VVPLREVREETRLEVSIPVENASGVAVGGGGVWVTSASDGTVTEYDLTGSSLLRRIKNGRSADGIVIGFGSAWVNGVADAQITRVDLSTGAIAARVSAPPTPFALAVDEEGVWVIQAPGFSFGVG
jgi:DNA-binding beta-propeller fold protein YncE